MLRLPLDSDPVGALLDDVLAGQSGPADIVLAIANALPALAARLAAGRIPGDAAAIIGVNDSGDKQKALDVGAHDHMASALRAAGVRQMLSEEAVEIECLNTVGDYDVAIDPIDGSGSIGIGAPLGVLFSIFPASPEGFLRTGRSIVAAGYASFGHSCDFGFSLGNGVSIATFDAGISAFRVTHDNVRLKPDAKTIAYNASNMRHWPTGLQDYAHALMDGKDGPLGRNFNMRWLAAAVGELHRILLLGGMFMYPADRRSGYENGRLRLIYEAGPIAFLIEQAGGKATDGLTPILDVKPTSHHQHTPLFFGSSNEVDLAGSYLAGKQKG